MFGYTYKDPAFNNCYNIDGAYFYMMFGSDFYDADFINPYGIGIILSGVVFRIN